MKRKVEIVLLTGGSSGIGAAAVRMLSAAGMKVYAGSRRGTVPSDCQGLLAEPSSVGGKGVVPVVMDVNDEESVARVVGDILKKEGHIDAVVCNAGNGIAGAVEQTSVEEGKYQFETCFWGAHRTIRAVLPSMRAQGFGRIITVSSVAAVVPIPYQTFYSSVKAATLMYTKSLSMEVKPFGIQCCSVLPGDTKTGFTAARKMVAEASDEKSVYFDITRRSVGRMEHDEQSGMPSSRIAEAILRQLRSRRMSPTCTPRLDYKAVNFFVRILPTRFMLWAVGKIYA